MIGRKVWTREQIEQLGVRTDGVTAMEILYGVGRTKAYELLRSGDAGVRVIRVPGAKTNRYVVSTAAILRALEECPAES
jgi:hypothetical protein